jgi:hypothetical protein
MCKYLNCKSSPVYGKRDDLMASFCSKHRGKDMFNLVSRKCLSESCTKTPNFNFEGEMPLWCGEHKISGMINTAKNKKCPYEDCKSRVTYNFEGLFAICCAIHAEIGMVDVIHTKCLNESCEKRANFGIEISKPTHCSKHMEIGMTRKIYKICNYETCMFKPSFNFQGLKPIFCSIHQESGMCDVVHKTCVHEGCSGFQNFNFKGLKPQFCFIHKEIGMVSVINNKRCINESCDKVPVYNVVGEKRGVACSEHKEDGMVNVNGQTCCNEFCDTQVRRTKYEGYCLFCFMNMFPDKPVSRNYKTKEYSVVEHIKSKYQELTWVADKIVQGGCSRRRPDLLLDLGYQILMVEVDENQHTGYDCSCEHKRIMELSQDVSHRPIVFIRFNPDDYKNEGKNVTSCWGIDKNGICGVKKSKQKEWEHRLESLETQIGYWIQSENKTNKTVEIIELFYDIMSESE